MNTQQKSGVAELTKRLDELIELSRETRDATCKLANFAQWGIAGTAMAIGLAIVALHFLGYL